MTSRKVVAPCEGLDLVGIVYHIAPPEMRITASKAPTHNLEE